MYGGTADMVKIESAERGFELHVSTDEGYFSFNVHGVAVELLEEVKRTIGEWYAEGQTAAPQHTADMVRYGHSAAWSCNPDESAGYALDDPKHPTYHERMSAIYDEREKV